MGGPIARVRDGDIVRVDAAKGTLEVMVDKQEFDARDPVVADLSANQAGVGRDLFSAFRAMVGSADTGAHVFGA